MTALPVAAGNRAWPTTLLLLTALSRLRGQGDDSAVVMLYAPMENSSERLTAFAAAAGPQIQQLLAATREAR